jgi:hypothetical protein
MAEAEMGSLSTKAAEYDPKEGTPANQVPNILKSQGIGAHTMANTPQTIQKALAEGKGVVSSHDAGRLWATKQRGGHAVHVTGVVRDAKGRVTHYIINDTGTGKAGQHVPAQQFEKSLIGAPATVTEKPISYGGREASEARRKAAKSEVKGSKSNSGATTSTIEGKDNSLKSQKTPEDSGKANPKLPEKLVSEPKSIWGKSVEQIQAEFQIAGYEVNVQQSTKGSMRSVQIRVEGHPEITNIQVHPGGGRHGGSYYKISTSTQGKIKVVDPDTYKPTEGEKADIIYIEK